MYLKPLMGWVFRMQTTRRSVNAAIGASLGLLVASFGKTLAADEGSRNSENESEETGEMNREQVSALKLERIETTGARALEEWERLKSEGSGWPIIVGDDQQLVKLVGSIDENTTGETVEQILARALKIRHPEDLIASDDKKRNMMFDIIRADAALPDDKLPVGHDIDENGELITLTPAQARKRLQAEIDAGPLPAGDWPQEVRITRGSFFSHDMRGAPYEKVNILLVPTADGAEALARLRWAGYNDCPATEFHVAALRSWADRFGAELVGLSDDALELRVSRRPLTRDAALVLAREYLAYCPDAGETLAPVAARLMQSDWWFFWWD